MLMYFFLNKFLFPEFGLDVFSLAGNTRGLEGAAVDHLVLVFRLYIDRSADPRDLIYKILQDV